MKSVYIDDALLQKLKRVAVENRQTLLSLLNRLVKDGLERLEEDPRHQRPSGQDPIGMFGTNTHKEIDIEEAYGEQRYQRTEKRDGRF